MAIFAFLDERDGTLYAGDELFGLSHLGITGWAPWWFPPQGLLQSRAGEKPPSSCCNIPSSAMRRAMDLFGKAASQAWNRPSPAQNFKRHLIVGLAIAIEAHSVDFALGQIGGIKPQSLALGVLVAIQAPSRHPGSILKEHFVDALNANDGWPGFVGREGDLRIAAAGNEKFVWAGLNEHRGESRSCACPGHVGCVVADG